MAERLKHILVFPGDLAVVLTDDLMVIDGNNKWFEHHPSSRTRSLFDLVSPYDHQKLRHLAEATLIHGYGAEHLAFGNNLGPVTLFHVAISRDMDRPNYVLIARRVFHTANSLPRDKAASDQEDLRRENLRLRYVLEGAGLGSWDWRIDTNTATFDRGWCQMLGLNVDEIRHEFQTWDSRVHPEDRLKAYDDIAAHLSGKVPVYENIHRMRHENGSWIWILARGRISEWHIDGRPKRFTGTHFEITHFKEMESLSACIQDMAQIGGWEFNIDTKRGAWTGEVLKIFGVRSEHELRGRKVFDYFPLSDCELLKKYLEQGSTGQSFRHNFRIFPGQGAPRWVEIMGEPVLDANGRIHKLRGTVQDITEKKTIVDDLVVTKTRLDELINVVPVGIFESDLDGSIKFVNSRWSRLTGVSEDKSHGLGWLQSVHPDDRDLVISEWRSAVRAQTDTRFVLRYLRADGKISYVQVRSAVLFDGQGKATGFLGTVQDVTELKQAQETLESTARELNQFFHLSLDPLCIADMDGHFLKINMGFSRVLGYSADELLSKPYLEFIHPEDVEKTQTEMQKLADGVATINFENRYRRKDGGYSILNWTASPELSCNLIYDTARDITQQKETEQRLEEAQRLARIGSWTLNVSTRNLTWSRQMFDLFSLTGSFGAPDYHQWLEMVHTDDLGNWQNALRQCIEKGQPFKLRARFMVKNHPVWMETIGHPKRDVEGVVLEVSGTCQDISDEIRAKEALEIERLKSLQSSKLATLGEMAAGIAHEINNPLAIIAGAMSLLQRRRDTVEQIQQRYATIEKATQRIARIVNGLRKYSRSSETSHRAAHNIQDVLKEALVLTEPKAKRAGVSITLNDRTRSPIYGSDIEIEQVLINLINNGIDAVCELKERWILIESFEENSEIIIHITDSGWGIAPEYADKLFQPFFTRKPVGSGTGLGLSIVKGIIADHNGRIQLLAEKAHTCFEVRLPIHSTENVPVADGKEFKKTTTQSRDITSSEAPGGGALRNGFLRPAISLSSSSALSSSNNPTTP